MITPTKLAILKREKLIALEIPNRHLLDRLIPLLGIATLEKLIYNCKVHHHGADVSFAHSDQRNGHQNFFSDKRGSNVLRD